jgi:membrane-associated phospholipid phosphatase
MFIICTSFFIYYVVFILFPVAGPQYYFSPPVNKNPEAYLFSKIMHLINCLGERPTGAFPSSHVGLISIVLFLSFKYIPNLLKWYIPIAIFLFMSTVYIKAHYLVDVFAGFISAPIIYWISSKLYQLLAKDCYNKLSVNQLSNKTKLPNF